MSSFHFSLFETSLGMDVASVTAMFAKKAVVRKGPYNELENRAPDNLVTRDEIMKKCVTKMLKGERTQLIPDPNGKLGEGKEIKADVLLSPMTIGECAVEAMGPKHLEDAGETLTYFRKNRKAGQLAFATKVWVTHGDFEMLLNELTPAHNLNETLMQSAIDAVNALNSRDTSVSFKGTTFTGANFSTSDLNAQNELLVAEHFVQAIQDALEISNSPATTYIDESKGGFGGKAPWFFGGLQDEALRYETPPVAKSTGDDDDGWVTASDQSAVTWESSVDSSTVTNSGCTEAWDCSFSSFSAGGFGQHSSQTTTTQTTRDAHRHTHCTNR